jgi:hypothetical protein
MLRQDVINNFPTEKPRRSRYCPPPEGRSPGAEGTATGAHQPACADCRAMVRVASRLGLHVGDVVERAR